MALIINRTPELSEVIRVAMEHRLASVNVAIPGRIEAYDNEKQSADVQPLLIENTLSPDGKELAPETIPVIQDVPVVFQRGGGFFLSFPLSKGDLVLLVVCQRSIDAWTAGDGSETDPRDLRKHHIADAVAFPGLYPFTRSVKDASAKGLRLGRDDGGVQLSIGQEEAEFSFSGKDKQSAVIGEELKSYIDSLVTALNAHTHPTGVGPSGAPIPTGPGAAFSSYSTSDVHSNVVKVPKN